MKKIGLGLLLFLALSSGCQKEYQSPFYNCRIDNIIDYDSDSSKNWIYFFHYDENNHFNGVNYNSYGRSFLYFRDTLFYFDRDAYYTMLKDTIIFHFLNQKNKLIIENGLIRYGVLNDTLSDTFEYERNVLKRMVLHTGQDSFIEIKFEHFDFDFYNFFTYYSDWNLISSWRGGSLRRSRLYFIYDFFAIELAYKSRGLLSVRHKAYKKVTMTYFSKGQKQEYTIDYSYHKHYNGYYDQVYETHSKVNGDIIRDTMNYEYICDY
ncbi:MAG: hypothetical protein MUE53_04065 [Chitinophagales bacterium]|jgi:hypothetical protein|nr:hypothetical protein [Chitinophagales bacterium]